LGPHRGKTGPIGAARRHQPHEGEISLADFVRQFLDLETRLFGIDAGLAGVVEFECDGLEVNHPLTFPNEP
jgi:hypothetical protein